MRTFDMKSSEHDNDLCTDKVDFKVYFTVTNANPNGDPSAENVPRTNYEGYGKVTAECIKRKIRNYMTVTDEPSVYLKSDDLNTDEYSCLKDRMEATILSDKDKKKNKKPDIKECAKIACETWLDVRLFGMTAAYTGAVSFGVRGAVTINDAISVDPIDIEDIGITKCCSGSAPENGNKGSDTMGSRHSVRFGLYCFIGHVNPLIAQKNGLTNGDVKKLIDAIVHMFDYDASCARPAGSMVVRQVYVCTQGAEEYILRPDQIYERITASAKEGTYILKSINDYVISCDLPKEISTHIIEL